MLNYLILSAIQPRHIAGRAENREDDSADNFDEREENDSDE